MPYKTIKTQELEIRTLQSILIVVSVLLIGVCSLAGYLLFKHGWVLNQ